MKAKRFYEFKIRVSGTGTFPIDMLRYCRAMPLEESDAGRIEASIYRKDTDDPVSVNLLVRSVNKGLTANEKLRWQSYHWPVTAESTDV